LRGYIHSVVVPTIAEPKEIYVQHSPADFL
jgi:hypothetical protein